MNEKEILEGNKLIAEFMGYKYFKSPYGAWGLCKDEKDMSTWLAVNNAKYDSSWDWLMPVIDKIEDMGFRIAAQKQIVSITMLEEFLPRSLKIDAEQKDTKLENAFDAVFIFIVWYNNYKLIP